MDNYSLRLLFINNDSTALSLGKRDETQKSYLVITKGSLDPGLSDIRTCELFILFFFY